MLLEKVLKGNLDSPKWEKRVMRYAHLTQIRSSAIWTQHLSGYLVWLHHEVRYRTAVAAQRWDFIILYLDGALN